MVKRRCVLQSFGARSLGMQNLDAGAFLPGQRSERRAFALAWLQVSALPNAGWICAGNEILGNTGNAEDG